MPRKPGSFQPAGARNLSITGGKLQIAAWLMAGLTCLVSFPVFAQTNFAVLANDGAWTWFNDPRAVFNHGILYFGCVRASDGRSALSALNVSSGIVTDLWSSRLTQLDDHDVPGLLVKQDGTMLAVYSRHQSDQFFTYRLSTGTNPITPADWGAEQTNNTGTTVASGMTYANPFQLPGEGGHVYNFARYLNYNPNVFTSTNGGATWSAPVTVIQTGSGSTRPYVKYCSDYNQRIDLLYTDAHPDNYTNSLYHLYYQGGAFYKTDGTFVKNFADLPIRHDAGERGSIIYQYSDAAQTDPNQWIPSGRAWCWEIAYQTNGAPVCVFQAKVDDVTGTSWSDARIYYYYARWTGTNWQKRFIAQAGRPLYNGQPDYGGGICLDPLDANTIYISTDAANPFDLSTTTSVPLGANCQIWKGITTDGGLTFTWQPVTGNSTVDNLRPYIPRRFGGEPCVLWFRGIYTSYTSFNSEIVGRFTTQVPQTNATSGTWNVDADGRWSDPVNWANGILADGAANTADFGTLNLNANRTVTLDTSRTLGTLRFGDLSASHGWRLNSSNGSVLTLSAGAPAIVVNQNTATLAVPLTGTNGFTKSGAGTLVLTAANSLAGTLNLDSGSTSANDGAVTVTTSAAVANLASPINFRNNTGPNAVASFQLDGSSGGVIVSQNFSTTCRNNSSPPTFENLAGTNTLAGTNFVQVGGTNVIYQADAGSWLLVTAPIQYVGSLTAARTVTFTGAGNVTLSAPLLAAANNLTPIGLLKTGGGTLTLAGANTYTNGTTINGGTVQMNGRLALGRVNVVTGTLGGTGIINGPVNISAGGRLAPGGDATGILTINNVLTNTGTILIKLDKTGSTLTNDAIHVASTLVFGGTLSVTNIGSGTVTAGDNFKIFSAATYQGAFTAILPATPGIGLAWNTTNLVVTGTLSVSATASPHLGTVIQLRDGNFQFSGTGAAGVTYGLEAATNLFSPGLWVWVTNAMADQSGSLQFMDPQATNFSQRFYRMAAE